MLGPGLSAVELDVLHLIADGLSDREIAAALCKSLDTIRSHRDHIFAKTGSHNRVQLTRYAIAAGLVSTPWKTPEKLGKCVMTGRAIQATLDCDSLRRPATARSCARTGTDPWKYDVPFIERSTDNGASDPTAYSQCTKSLRLQAALGPCSCRGGSGLVIAAADTRAKSDNSERILMQLRTLLRH